MIVKANIDRSKKSANALINKYGITHAEQIQLEDIAFAEGIDVRESGLTNCEAQLIRRGKCGVIRIREGEKETPRGRFSIGHELGHWFLHENKNQRWICNEAQIHHYKGSTDEIEANAFSGELLMPSHIFRKKCKGRPLTIGVVSELASDFRTSLTATALRMVDEATQPVMVVMSSEHEVLWSTRSSALSGYEFYVPKGFYTDQFTLAHHTIIDGDQERGIVLTESWFPELKNPDEYVVWEETKWIGSYNLSLSLMTIEQPI